MKKITMFMFESCPHCKLARKCLDELKAEQRAARQIIPSTTSSQASSQKKEGGQEDEDPDDGKKRPRSIRDALRSFFGRAPEDSGADLDW